MAVVPRMVRRLTERIRSIGSRPAQTNEMQGLEMAAPRQGSEMAPVPLDNLVLRPPNNTGLLCGFLWTPCGRVAAIFLLCLMALAVIFGGFFFFAYITFDSSYPKVVDVDIRSMYVNMSIDNYFLSTQGKLSLRVVFNESTNIMAYPDMGTFIVHDLVKSNHNHTIYIVSQSRYRFVEMEQSIVVNFDPRKTRLQKNQLADLKKKLAHGRFWMDLDGDFRMHVKFRRFSFPSTHKHAYFSCRVSFISGPPFDVLEKKRCWVQDHL